MAKAADLLKAAPQYLGRAYINLDCQAFVEACLRDIGINENLAGSNAWYRKMDWVGTPEECIKTYGMIPAGAFLFILKKDGGEPQKYRSDGIGNASHIGIYTGLTAKDMLAEVAASVYPNEWEAFVKKVSHGDGAIHSSSSRGCVCTSKFAGKSISGGWNRVGLWTDTLDYELPEKKPQPVDMPGTGVVYAANGKPVKMRAQPSTNCNLYWMIPVGTEVEVLGTKGSWTNVNFNGWLTGWMMSEFLRPSGSVTATYTVTISGLTQQQSLDLLKAYPTADVQMERG